MSKATRKSKKSASSGRRPLNVYEIVGRLRGGLHFYRETLGRSEKDAVRRLPQGDRDRLAWHTVTRTNKQLVNGVIRPINQAA